MYRVKTTILVECANKGLFDLFMGQSSRFPSANTFLKQLEKDMEKVKKKDPTADYIIDFPTEKSIFITITGKDETVKQIFKKNIRDNKKIQHRMTLKALRTKITNELIK